MKASSNLLWLIGVLRVWLGSAQDYRVSVSDPFLLNLNYSKISGIFRAWDDRILVSFLNSETCIYSADFSSHFCLNLPEPVQSFKNDFMVFANIPLSTGNVSMNANYLVTLSNDSQTIRNYKYPSMDPQDSYFLGEKILFFQGGPLETYGNFHAGNILVTEKSVKYAFKSKLELILDFEAAFGGGIVARDALNSYFDLSISLDQMYFYY